MGLICQIIIGQSSQPCNTDLREVSGQNGHDISQKSNNFCGSSCDQANQQRSRIGKHCSDLCKVIIGYSGFSQTVEQKVCNHVDQRLFPCHASGNDHVGSGGKLIEEDHDGIHELGILIAQQGSHEFHQIILIFIEGLPVGNDLGQSFFQHGVVFDLSDLTIAGKLHLGRIEGYHLEQIMEIRLSQRNLVQFNKHCISQCGIVRIRMSLRNEQILAVTVKSPCSQRNVGYEIVGIDDIVDVVVFSSSAVGINNTFRSLISIDKHVLTGKVDIADFCAVINGGSCDIGCNGGTAVADHPEFDGSGDALIFDIGLHKVKDLICCKLEAFPVAVQTGSHIAGPLFEVVVSAGTDCDQSGSVRKFLVGAANGHGIKSGCALEEIIALITGETAFLKEISLVIALIFMSHTLLAEGSLCEVHGDDGQILRHVITIAAEVVITVSECTCLVRNTHDAHGRAVGILTRDHVAAVSCKYCRSQRDNEG